jgi:phage baseplate assembly protein gpV
MKKNVFVLALFCIVSMMANAEVAKYCMSNEDFVADNWKSVDELTAGRTKQVCQIKSGEHGVFHFKTGDKESDQVLKKEAFAVMYGKQLFVNCRNLRYKDGALETSQYVQAIRYDKNKLCILAYRTDIKTALAEVGTGVAGILVDNTAVSLGLIGTSVGFGIANSNLSNLKCYLIDSGANEKGKIALTRINDEYMEQLLADDAALLERYKAIKAKHNRQSAANILPILLEKGLVESVAN